MPVSLLGGGAPGSAFPPARFAGWARIAAIRVRAGHGRWLAAWSMHQAKAYLLDHRYAIDPSGMYHDWAIGDPLVVQLVTPAACPKCYEA